MLIKLNISTDNRSLGNHTPQTVMLKQASFPYLRMASDVTGKEKLGKMPN